MKDTAAGAGGLQCSSAAVQRRALGAWPRARRDRLCWPRASAAGRASWAAKCARQRAGLLAQATHDAHRLRRGQKLRGMRREGRRWHCSQSRGGQGSGHKDTNTGGTALQADPVPTTPTASTSTTTATTITTTTAPATTTAPTVASAQPHRRPALRYLHAPRLAAPMHHPAVLPCCRAATKCLPLTMMKHLRPHHHVISTSLSHPHIHPAQSPFALPSPCFLVIPVTPVTAVTLSPRRWALDGVLLHQHDPSSPCQGFTVRNVSSTTNKHAPGGSLTLISHLHHHHHHHHPPPSRRCSSRRPHPAIALP
jgi:hypothetical protein